MARPLSALVVSQYEFDFHPATLGGFSSTCPIGAARHSAATSAALNPGGTARDDELGRRADQSLLRRRGVELGAGQIAGWSKRSELEVVGDEHVGERSAVCWGFRFARVLHSLRVRSRAATDKRAGVVTQDLVR